MAGFKYSVHGGKELAADFAALSAKIRGPVLGDAALAGAVVIETEAKEQLTRNVSRKSGNLFRSIHSEITSQSAAQATAAVGTNVEYGPYVEYGTGIHGPKGQPIVIRYNRRGSSRAGVPRRITVEYEHPGMKPKPFLMPAADAKQAEAGNAVADAVWMQVRKIAA